MKATIRHIKFRKEWHSPKFNADYFDFDIGYEVDGIFKDGVFTTTKNPQTVFEVDKEYEITEEQREYQGNIYYKIKLVKENSGGSNYSRKLKQEQARYSSFAVAYCKDLIIADKLPLDKWEQAAKKIAKAMLDIDKELGS